MNLIRPARAPAHPGALEIASSDVSCSCSLTPRYPRDSPGQATELDGNEESGDILGLQIQYDGNTENLELQNKVLWKVGGKKTTEQYRYKRR